MEGASLLTNGGGVEHTKNWSKPKLVVTFHITEEEGSGPSTTFHILFFISHVS
jgi:hypothetical protein